MYNRLKVTFVRFLALIFMAVGLYGQSSENAISNPSALIDRAVGGIENSSWGLGSVAKWPGTQIPSRPLIQAVAHKQPSACSVPLLEAPVNDKNFPIQRVSPPPENMPATHGLPPCPPRE